MAKKRYKVDILSMSSIEKLKQQLTQYRNSLDNKCKRLVEELADLGLEVAQVSVNESPLGKYVSLSVATISLLDGVNALLIARGEVKQSDGYEDFSTILAIEFGAGIYHNKKINPKAGELGYGPGTFPGQIHAMEDGWYYWDEKEQTWRYTHGVKATMPMYNAHKEMKSKIEKVARKVFK